MGYSRGGMCDVIEEAWLRVRPSAVVVLLYDVIKGRGHVSSPGRDHMCGVTGGVSLSVPPHRERGQPCDSLRMGVV